MKHKGFTIVELVIAIAIFSLIIVYMYQAVATTKKGNELYERNYKVVTQHEEAKKIFYNDIFNQVNPYSNIEFKSDIFYLRTNNTLYALIAPYVAYMVKDKKLIRIETVKKTIFPLKEENSEKLVLETNTILDDIEDFNVLIEKNSYIIQWTQKAKKTIFQLKLPYYRKVVIVDGTDTNTSK